MSAYGQPLQTNGFKTSIEIYRGQSSGHNNSTGNSINNFSNSSQRPTTSVKQLAGHKRLPENSPGEPVPLRKVSNDFRTAGYIRDSSSIPKSRLVASQIHQLQRDTTGVNSGVGPLPLHNPQHESPEESQELPLNLDDPCYGLPTTLVANFALLGVKNIYPWQASCLLGPGLLTGERHLVYTAPTGGGKSLVADVLMLKRVIENPSRKAILVLPYVALVQEKLKWLRRIVQDVEKSVDANDVPTSNPYRRRWDGTRKSIQVSGYFGGSKTAASWVDTDIAVCTIEKVWFHCSFSSVCTLLILNRQIR